MRSVAGAHLVEARVADVAGGEGAILEQDERQHAGHAAQVGLRFRLLMDLIVGERDRLAHAFGRRADLELEALADRIERDLRRLFARGLAADAVDHREAAAIGIGVDAILVGRADAPDVRTGRDADGRSGHDGRVTHRGS